jgi:hypothetical protein
MLKLWRLPKIEDSMERWSVCPLWPTYLGEKGRTLSKTYGIKVRRYWEHPLGNTLGTHWESDGNTLGTERKHVGNKEKMKKNPPRQPPTPPQNLKENKSMHFEYYAC